MDKDQLQKEFLKKRQDFIVCKKPADLNISQKFINLPMVKKAQTICFYVSMADEVETHKLIKYYLHATGLKAKCIIVPKIIGKNLKLYKIKSFSDLSPGKFGILEPKAGSRRVTKNQVDLFVVPGIVFSKFGQRLGFGQGYYDRLLRNTKAFKLGLAYSWQVVDKLPVDKKDVFMDLVLTSG